jgi:glyceraldehyde-3-phosphate dehydrogenase/erythrose-4-phosphate dehydrogenase
MTARVAIGGLGRVGRATLESVLGNEIRDEDSTLEIQGRTIQGLSEKDPASPPWHDLDAVPSVDGHFDGVALRVPVASGSIADVVAVTTSSDPRASLVDLTLTQVTDGDLIKVMSWYDNEWGYAQQMVRHAMAMMGRRVSSSG